jgi:hypothetical protein
MPFDEPFDPDTPGDNDPLSQGDDRIRELKRALNERLVQVIEGWPGTDPLKLKAAAIDSLPTYTATLVGLESEKPNPPTAELFYATDTKRLYVKVAGSPSTYEPISTDVTGTGVVQTVTTTATITGIVAAGVEQMVAVEAPVGFGTHALVGARARLKRLSSDPFPKAGSWFGTNTVLVALSGGESLSIEVRGVFEIDMGVDSNVSHWQVMLFANSTDAGPHNAIAEIKLHLLKI